MSLSVIIPGFPPAVLQKLQEIGELSRETSSSLSVCLSLFSRQEGVSVMDRLRSLFEFFVAEMCLVSASSQVHWHKR